MLKEFRAFVMRGNIVDLAVAVVIGAAFGAIVKSLVDDVIMPPIGLALGKVDFANLFVVLKNGPKGTPPYASLAEAKAAGAVTVNYGTFFNNVVAFLIVGLAVFLLVRVLRWMQHVADSPIADKTCEFCATKIPLAARRCPNCTSQLAAALLLIVALVPAVAGAQAPRKIEAELSGNVFYGNTRQILTSARSEYERADSVFAFRTQARVNYGQTTTDGIGTIVSKRSWLAGSSYDFHPFADLSPFLRATIESSLESRIARRYSGGAGSRFNITRTPATDAILSAGVIGERTEPMPPIGGGVASATTLARGVSSLRLRRDLSERVAVTSETSYQPALSRFSDYTAGTLNTLKVKLSSIASLTVSWRDNYDSQAVIRGARTNNDGEVLFGLLTTF